MGENEKPDPKSGGKVKLTYEISKDTDDEFRKTVAQTKGLRKGVLGASIEEAIKLWIRYIEEQERKEKRSGDRK